jgi:hypothetical protein
MINNKLHTAYTDTGNHIAPTRNEASQNRREQNNTVPTEEFHDFFTYEYI